MSALPRYFDQQLGVWVTKCPPGEAIGARDLANWSRRRARGLSGSDDRKAQKEARKFAIDAPVTAASKLRFGKHKGKTVAELPISYLRWGAETFHANDPWLPIFRAEIKTRKRGVAS